MTSNTCDRCNGTTFTAIGPPGANRFRCDACGWQMYFPRGLLCSCCDQPKQPGTICHGNDQCIYGRNGGKASCCEGWGRYCCRCGASYAVGQL